MGIGEKIREQVKIRGLSVAEFARRLSTSPQNVYTIFQRESLDSGLLQRISKVLDYDFSKLYSIHTSENEPTPDYKTINIELEDCKTILEFYKEKFKLLEEIIMLQRNNIELLKREKHHIKPLKINQPNNNIT